MNGTPIDAFAIAIYLAYRHSFADALRVVYVAVMYFRSVGRHVVKVNLWSDKCCIIPLKLIRVPKLEFLTCVLLSRFIVSVKKLVVGIAEC